MDKSSLIRFFLVGFFIIRVNAKIKKNYNADDQICRNISTLNIHPLDCCCYPRFIDNPNETRDKCHEECISMPNDFSCIRNCVISESGVISKGVVNPISVTRLFYECSEDGEEMEPITKPWRAVIANSVRKCEVELPKEIAPDDYNFYYSRFVECVRKENFLNCPDFSADDKCQKMKEMMRSCKSSSADYLHEIFFEDFYYREKEERAGNYRGMLYDEL